MSPITRLVHSDRDLSRRLITLSILLLLICQSCRSFNGARFALFDGKQGFPESSLVANRLASDSSSNILFEEGFDMQLQDGLRIVSSEYEGTYSKLDTLDPKSATVIQLNNIAGGFGSGSHPTTKMCLDFLLDHVAPGMNFLDYGTGSGILSIVAAKRGCARCVGVDVDESAIAAAIENCQLNHVDHIVDIVHTKDVYVGDATSIVPLCDITVANILAGALVRMVSPIVGFTKPGGLLCLSGIRPNEVESVTSFYKPFVLKESIKVTVTKHPKFGEWVRWTGQVISDKDRLKAITRSMEQNIE